MIQNLEEIRTDGKLIPESMALDAMLALGWRPCRVSAVRWTDGDRRVDIAHRAGITIHIVPGRCFAAALLNTHPTGSENQLLIFNSDGTVRHRIESVQHLNGEDDVGAFLWFETSATQPVNTFGAVFEVRRNNASFKLDIDAEEGVVLRAVQMK